MESDLIFVYASAEGDKRALTRDADGANLPRSVQWLPHDQIPMTLSAIETYAPRADVALMHLIIDGYFVEQRSADIIAFPKARRTSP
jgi:hypothetical protein